MPPLAKFALNYAHKTVGESLIVHADCLEWMGRTPENSIHGIVTDPPYGLKEYEFDQLEKRANGNGGIWRIPPSFDGSVRQPLPRFTALNAKERAQVCRFFTEWPRLPRMCLGRAVTFSSLAFPSCAKWSTARLWPAAWSFAGS